MDNFKTDNQDKSNLVGDAKLMSDAVDREQERLALIDEVRELKSVLQEISAFAAFKPENKELQDIKKTIDKIESIRGES